MFMTMLTVSAALFVVAQSARAAQENEQPIEINPAARVALTFAAAAQTDGVTVSWQVPEAEGGWFYTVYRSTDCEWNSAVAVDAPIFASTESISRTISYSLTDRFGSVDSAAPVVATCNYWLVGADGAGDVQIYDSTTLSGIEHIFLPQIANQF
jgi:hypothetical protein